MSRATITGRIAEAFQSLKKKAEQSPMVLKKAVQHRKGGLYIVEGQLKFQTSVHLVENGTLKQKCVILNDQDTITIYRDFHTGALYGRLPDEFNDGRFTEVGDVHEIQHMPLKEAEMFLQKYSVAVRELSIAKATENTLGVDVWSKQVQDMAAVLIGHMVGVQDFKK